MGRSALTPSETEIAHDAKRPVPVDAAAASPMPHDALGAKQPGGSRAHVYLLAIIVVTGVLVRSYQLSARSFWFDEAFSWRMIEFPFSEMIERAGLDNHTPLYFVLLRGWAALFGTSAFALRSLSVVFGALTILGMYLFVSEAYRAGGEQGDKQTRRRAGALFAAALVALSVFQIRWSWEVRMYTLGTALAAFSSWAMFRALRLPARPLNAWVLYGMLVSLFAYSHYYAIFSIAAQGIFILGYLLAHGRGDLTALQKIKSLWYPGSALGILVVACLPWLPVFLRQRGQVQTDFWTTPVRAWDVPNVCYQMLVEPENATYSFTQPLVATLMCAAIMLVLLWKARAADWYLFGATLIPFVLSVLVSAVDTKVFHLRYFLFSNLFLLASVAVVVARVPHVLERRLLCSWILIIFLCIDFAFWEGLNISSKPGARACTAFLAEKRKAGEPVVVCSPLLYFSVLYHAENRSGWFVYNDGRGVVHYEGGAIISPDDLIFDAGLEAIDSPRIWVVDMTGWGTRTVPVPGSWTLAAEIRFPEVYHVQGDILLRQYTASRSRK